MTTGDCVIEGRALIGEDLEVRDVAIVVKRGRIHRIEDIAPRSAPWICPALFNAHTHLGDSVAMDIRVEGSLENLVTPPDGLKHRILSKTPSHELIQAMRATLCFMETGGTAGCADFREGGPAGVRALRSAARGVLCRPLIFGREGGELIGDGIGISSARDVPGLEQVISRSRNKKRLIAFHAGERDRFDVDHALSFEPDLLVHCTYATRSQLRRCAEMEVPIAVCARSNWTLGVTDSARRPPLAEMLDTGCRIFLGTDNCMVIQPDLWREMSFVSTVYRIPPARIYRAAVEGSLLTGNTSFISEGAPARFLVIQPEDSNLWLSRDMVRTLVMRAGALNIVTKVINS
ncbi:MAG: amidohydrolase [Methanoregulaceae archaeon]|nr:amidohydrolase [Methanoregulaceae archaeon]